jgi:hypothetical protein
VSADQSLWESDEIQFPRLLSEIFASGLTSFQYEDLCKSMGLERRDIDELLLRAEAAWEKKKSSLPLSLKREK